MFCEVYQMELSMFLRYDQIVIQCHDAPDADAFASGFALYCYLADHGKKPRFVYAGHSGSLKPNLQAMKDLLQIPVEYVTDIPSPPDLLVLVDCQYGEKNVQLFSAKEVAVIDHHQMRNLSTCSSLCEILENYGSCATVMYGMLQREKYDFNHHLSLQTALYYGLYMDTSQLQELWHPADRDLRDALSPDEDILSILKNTNLASSDLHIIGEALATHEVDPLRRFAITRVNTQDRNLLGIVGDMLLQLDCADACVAYACMDEGIRFSVRSCTREVRADELVLVLADGIGSGGGHMRKAAGFLDRAKLQEPGSFPEVILQRLRQYFDETDTFHAGREMDTTDFRLYQKKPVTVGVADLNEIFPSGTDVMLRTLEGDITLTVNPDRLLMIGISGEIYPISREAFARDYTLTGHSYVFPEYYIPAVRDSIRGAKVSLPKIARECISHGEGLVYARKLSRRTHVFTLWDSRKYIYGNPGDWIAMRQDDPRDVYIIAKDIFAETYDAANPSGISAGGVG